MVPTEDLTCALREKDAPTVSAENPGFNIIPIKRGRQIAGYYDRDSAETKPVTVHDLISDGTSILALVSILADRPFYFILAHARIAGYVHFSDLNNHLVKLTLYTIIEALESHTLAAISPSIDEDYLGQWLGKKRFRSIKRKFELVRKKEANRSWADFLNIEDILRLAVRAGKIRLDEHLIKAIKRMRDRVAHQINPLVKRHRDVIELAQITSRCIELLGNNQLT
jgi:hypothetical protein